MAGGKIDILVEPDLRGFPGKLQSGLQGATGAAAGIGRGIGLALAAGLAGAAVAIKEIVTLGNQYQGTLNEMQAVTGATAEQMGQVGSTAKALGSDLTLSGVSAADAAGAMLELAKGGLTVDEAMQAAKGTLQLAGAAQIEGARAAEIQAQAINQFGLAASDAGRVADTLANTANAASGGIEDIALAMKYVGPVAASMNISMEDTATAVGLLANNGILADTAGTSLRGMLVSLASPSKQAAKGISALGITAFDSQGRFVGFRSVIEQLNQAQGRMTDEQFASAAALAFGREPLAAITALAREGGPAFDEMRLAVGKQGGAAEVAAAKMQGLGGAMEGLKSNLETAAIGIYEVIDGPLESLVRTGAAGVDQFNDFLTHIGEGGIPPGLQGIVDTGTDLFDNLVGILGNVRDAATPVVDGILAVIDSLGEGGGTGEIFLNTLRGIGSAAEFASGLLVPLGGIIGDLLGLFADLPGPIQAAVLALAALKLGPALLGGLRGGLNGVRTDAEGAARSTGLLSNAVGRATAPVRGLAGAARQFNDEMKVQRGLASAAGEPIGRLAGYQAAFETSTIGAVAAARNFRNSVRDIQAGAAAAGQPISTMTAAVRALGERSPAIAAMATSFSTASRLVASGADVIAAGARRAAESVGPGLASAASGTVSAFRAIPGAVSGAASALGTGIANAASRAATGLRSIPATVSSAASSLGTGLANAARTAGDAFQQIPTRVSSAMSTAAGAIRGFPGVVQSAFRAIPGAIETGISALGRFAGVATGIGASAFSGLLRAGGSLVSFLGGPWGVALAAAGVALTILGQKQAEAQKAAQEHQAALDSLAGTLNQYSGAVTQATINEKASQLAKDGTLTKVKELGISTQDYVRAALGEEGALQRVQAQLTTHTRGLIEASNAYQNGLPELRNLGIGIDDLTAAAQGNVPAMDRINAAIGNIADLDAQSQVRSLVGAMLDAGKASGDLAAELGISNGELAKIQEQTRLATEASGDFVAKLDLIKAGLGGLKDGGQQTETMKTGLQGLATAAADAATKAGETAKSLGGVTAGGQAAAASMQKSRDAFVEAAAEALGSREAAEALANQLGLLPEAQRIIFETNATGVQAEFITLGQQVAAVPDAKAITVQTLSDEAKARLDALGIQVRTLPNGQVEVLLQDQAARDRFNGLVALMSSTTATMLGDMNVDRATQKITQTVNLGNGQTATLRYDANPVDAEGKIHATVDLGNGQTAQLTYDANPDPATGKINVVVDYGNGQHSTITLDPKDLVSGVIDHLKQPTSSTHTIHVVQIWESGAPGQPGRTGLAAGGIVSAMHDGGVLGMAGGGKLTPMRGGLARVVKPNTWRVIGDRLADDEAYIPINRSRRSAAIFEETARRMGYMVARMYADGGVAESAQDNARTVAAMVNARGGGSAAIVAQLAQLGADLASVQRQQVQIVQNFNVPSAERASDKAAHNMRRLGAQGLLGRTTPS